MLIFIPTYVLLALASWSALAAPIKVSKSNENGNSHMIFFFFPDPSLSLTSSFCGTCSAKAFIVLLKSSHGRTIRGAIT